MSFDTFNVVFQAIQAIGIIGALFFAARQYAGLKKEVQLKAYNETVNRMYSIRTLLISDPHLHKLFDGGLEGEALKKMECYKHFYLMKMIFHMNQSLYLQIEEESPGHVSLNKHYGPWRNNLKGDLTAPIARSIWNDNAIVRDSFEESFQEEVASIIKEIESNNSCSDSIASQENGG